MPMRELAQHITHLTTPDPLNSCAHQLVKIEKFQQGMVGYLGIPINLKYHRGYLLVTSIT